MNVVDISIGPVQGFVAQSRRTRDLWGSSYLLSFLSAHAMTGAQEVGELLRPVMGDDPLMRRVRNEPTPELPTIGSVPNHFVVAPKEEPQRVVDEAMRRFQQAWVVACDAVWDRFMAHAEARGNGTRAIWDRQVGGFWEIQWTVGENLRRRKHWRTHRLPAEGGDKCSVIHDLQELSGYARSARGERERQVAFWAQVRTRTGKLDLREDEQLSAIALIKRLFPKVSRRALGWRVETTRWPSSAYVSAVPWIAGVTQAAGEAAAHYAAAVQEVCPEAFAGEPPPIAAVQDNQHPLARIDASYLHRGFVADPRLCPLRTDAGPHATEGELFTAKVARDELVERLRELYRAASGPDVERRVSPVGAPPVFYALLLADGDRLGDVVKAVGADLVGSALTAFTASVKRVVAEHNGVTVYAGGDDVLAMLPVEDALRCARALRQRYEQCFAPASGEDGAIAATLSACVVFAHVRLPQGRVLAEAHRLLDEVAKRDNGRDSLAASVLKRGGLHCEWVSGWRRPAPNGAERAVDAVELVDALANGLVQADVEAGVSSSLLFRLRETLSLLCGWPRWEPGRWGYAPEHVDLHAFLHAEVAHSLGVQHGGDAEEGSAQALTTQVHQLLLPARNAGGPPRGTKKCDVPGVELGLDGLLLARFVAQGGREEDS